MKYQIWDTKHRAFVDHVVIAPDGVFLILVLGDILPFPSLEQERYKARYFTGLPDKHGKDMYSGDIVIWDGGQYTITFSEVEGCWILKDDRDDWECPSLYGVRSPAQSRIEIIGNVYENLSLP